MPTTDDNPAIVAGKERAAVVVELAREWNVTPASLAFSFALSHPALGQRAVRRHHARSSCARTSPRSMCSTPLDDDQRRRLNDLATS